MKQEDIMFLEFVNGTIEEIQGVCIKFGYDVDVKNDDTIFIHKDTFLWGSFDIEFNRVKGTNIFKMMTADINAKHEFFRLSKKISKKK